MHSGPAAVSLEDVLAKQTTCKGSSQTRRLQVCGADGPPATAFENDAANASIIIPLTLSSTGGVRRPLPCTFPM